MGLKENRARQGELARAYLLDHLRKVGLKVNSELDREFGQLVVNFKEVCPELKTTKEELLEFYAILADETHASFQKRTAQRLEKKDSH